MDSPVSFKQTHIQVERPEGEEVTYEGSIAFVQGLKEQAKGSGCNKIMIVGKNTKISLSVADIYNLGKNIAETGLKIAIVEEHNTSENNTKLLEDVVHNRGNHLRFYDDQNEALAWLLEE